MSDTCAQSIYLWGDNMVDIIIENDKKLPKLDLNVTNRCNFRCAHCAFDSGIWNLCEFSLDKIREILQDTKDLGGTKIDITGGEPLMREDVADIMRIAKGLGYKVELVTNGSLLTDKKLKLFKEIGLDSIAISLDGSDYETYNIVRKVPIKIYETVLRNIRLAVENGFDLKINTLACQENYRDIPNIAEFCLRSGIKEQGIYYFTPVGRGVRDGLHAVEPRTWLDFIRKRLMKYDNMGDKTKMKMSLEVPMIEKGRIKKEIRCIADSERYHLQILPDGNVYPCAILASYIRPIANLNKVSVKDIWQNKALWEDYWHQLSDIRKRCRGHCVDFSGFDIGNMKGYDLVCPLRKYTPYEVG